MGFRFFLKASKIQSGNTHWNQRLESVYFAADPAEYRSWKFTDLSVLKIRIRWIRKILTRIQGAEYEPKTAKKYTLKTQIWTNEKRLLKLPNFKIFIKFKHKN